MVTSSTPPEENKEISATLMNIVTDKETRESRPKLCINGVEVDLNTDDDMVIRKITTVVESYSKVVATPNTVKPISMTIPTIPEAYVEAIFGPMPVVAPLFSTPSPSSAFRPPPSPSINASSITPIAASVSTAPTEARGFIEPIFGSELSDQGFGMFYTPSVVPCKREGTPLEKDNEKAQEKVPPPKTTTDNIVDIVDIIEGQYAAITPPPSPVLAKVSPFRFPPASVAPNIPENITTTVSAIPDPGLVNNERYHEYDFRSPKTNCGTLYMRYNKPWVLDHAPHLLARTDENNKTLLHPGHYTKAKSPRTKKTSSSPQKERPKYIPALDIKARRGTPLIAVVRSLTTVPDSAFDPKTGMLRKEWLGKIRPQLFFPDGEMQEYVKIKNIPTGFDYPFFRWLRGDTSVKNRFDKDKIQRIVCKCLAEVARDERVFASHGVRR